MRLLLLSLLLCSSSFAAQKTKLALNWKPEPEFGGFYAAELNGAYKKQGLEVEILQGGSGTPVVQMLGAGKVDFGIVSADEVIMARAHGSDIVSLFAVYQTNPQGIMAHAHRGFSKISDVLKSDGVLAAQKGLPYMMYLEKKFGPPTVKIVPYAGGIANFLADEKFSQQCFVTSEPLEAVKKNAQVITFLVAESGYNPYTAVLATRGDVLRKKPKLAAAIVAAARAGWRDYLDHPEAANKFMGNLNKAMDAATFAASANAQKSLIESSETGKNGLGSMTEARWNELVQQMLELKLINKAPLGKDLFTNL